ncbi:MAG: DJ-1/PfpI family protein [Brevinematales bacterium]|jgi:4-methyl-5(b-hydroxyethyl)-thiazole monophosphate biosynthesis
MKYALIMGENFEETEAVTAIDLLRRAGVTIDIYGVGSSSIKGRSGLTIMTDRIFKNEADLDINEYGGILIPGGPGASLLAGNRALLNIVRGFNGANKLIYAICAAPMVLDRAGILGGRNYTCFPGTEISSGKRLEDRVVIDGNIITSQGVGTALDAAVKLVEIIVSAAESRKQAEKTLYHH